MADIRINALATTAASTASDDFIAVDGSANGTRKLNAYSPTFGGNLTLAGYLQLAAGKQVYADILAPSSGITLTLGSGSGQTATVTGNLTVSGTGTSNFGGAIAASNSFTLSSAGNSNGIFTSSSSTNAAYFTLANTGASGTSFDVGVGGAAHALTGIRNKLYSYHTSTGILETTDTAGNKTISGNLTVSGGTVTSGTGTLTLNSSANTVVLQSAGTTALTLDSSQNATFAGTVTNKGVILSANTALFSADAALSNYSAANGVYLNGNASGWLRLSGSGGGGAQIQLNGGTGSGATLVFGTNNGTTALTLDGSQNAIFAGTIKPQQAATASAPTYVKGAIYFDTTLNKLRVGGATGWETVTST